MRLDQLFPEEDVVIVGRGSVRVRGLAFDSRAVTPGDLFFAIRGVKVDGTAFVADAVTRGAAAVVVERGVDVSPGVPVVKVASARRALAHAADRFHGEPSREVATVAVTGTNGKTTTTYLIRSILAKAGLKPSLLGTIAYEVAGTRRESTNTTPDPLFLQRALDETRRQGGRALVTEASSHALDQDRLAGVRLRGGVFTNLARDHLDYHGDHASYLAAKRKLFEMLEPGAFAALNDRDPASNEMARATRARVIRFGGSRRCDVRARVWKAGLGGSKATFWFGGKSVPVKLPMIGKHNVENALAAASAAWAMDVPVETIVAGLEATRCVPGRLQPIDGICGPRVLVDYAHTPEALDRVLDGLRPLVRGRLIVVFGCGGDRDRGKRPLMARAVERHADVTIVTSDNPRSERPEAIASEIVKGFFGRAHEVVLDRRTAIFQAITGGFQEDLVVVAGKGHETGQIVAGKTLPFDDLEVCREALEERAALSDRITRPEGLRLVS